MTMRPLRAGDLRHVIVFQEPIATQSGVDTVITWQNFETVRASIEPLRGREFIEAQAVNTELTIRIKCYYVANLNPKMRILNKLTRDVYKILSIVNIENENYALEIMCHQIEEESDA